jgi:exodeoxyribonuclease-3
MKIATWNINSITSRLDQLTQWCENNQPDVLCLQETKCIDAKFPYKPLNDIGYDHIETFGEKTYNGVAILSKYPIDDVKKNLPDDKAVAAKRLISATINGLQIVNVYAPHGTGIGTEKYALKLKWFKRLRKHFDVNYDTGQNVLLCGDLNIAPHPSDVWNVNHWKDRLHFTKPERDAIQHLKKWGFVDAFRQMNEEPGEFSWWDYSSWAFRKNMGLRIDHIWTSEPLAGLCTDSWIDRVPRAWEHPSDHAPVLAEFMV